MRVFPVSITTFNQIQMFVSLAMKQPFDILVGNERQNINGKDFMGMASLDYTRPLQVKVNCSEEDFLCFRQAVMTVTQ